MATLDTETAPKLGAIVDGHDAPPREKVFDIKINHGTSQKQTRTRMPCNGIVKDMAFYGYVATNRGAVSRSRPKTQGASPTTNDKYAHREMC